VHILLPPSEGKTVPLSGPPLNLDSLALPGLRATRRKVLTALTRLCRTDPQSAVVTLGLGPQQAEDVKRDAKLQQQPCAAAMEIYSGVLFEALDYPSLPDRTRERADAVILVASALWGLASPRDLIPAYRLSGSVTLPGVGSMRSVWRAPITRVLGNLDGLIIDMRSGMYQQLAPPPSHATRWLTIRVLEERQGRLVTVSHSNKATKGRIARALLDVCDEPTNAASLTATLADHGFRAEASSTHAATIDVILAGA
jgi:uncharacterized protein